ncbi:TetR/AcrR family transcriptional regulator [Phyllobacterium sp. SB3]|uniref:TetR/AcrR family transcriptional regulator n=1 Tax=Phyllobacterium sp. SB3 TaxID=3156073 RepID=UPI0032AEDED5
MAQTRKKLLDAALQSFMRVGYTGATIEGISDDAGYSRGAFYAHFASKEDILLEIIAGQADQVAPILIRQIESVSSPNAMVEIVADWAEGRSQNQGLTVLMFEALQQAQRNGTLDERYAALFSKNWRNIGEAMRPFFPGHRLPCTPEEIVAIVVALSYSPVVSGASGHKAGRLVKLTLNALMQQT